MSTRIRLRRMGSNKRPFFRVVVADQRSPRDGRFIENIGKYHPLSDPSLIEIDEQRALHWLRVGAQPSNQVRVLLQRVGVWDRFVSERPKAAEGLKVRQGGKPEKPKLSKKAQAKAAEPEPEPSTGEVGVSAREETTGVAPAPAAEDAAAGTAPEGDEATAEVPEEASAAPIVASTETADPTSSEEAGEETAEPAAGDAAAEETDGA